MHAGSPQRKKHIKRQRMPSFILIFSFSRLFFVVQSGRKQLNTPSDLPRDITLCLAVIKLS